MSAIAVNNLSIIIKSSAVPTIDHARWLAAFYRLPCLDPGTNYLTPTSAETLADTTPKGGQWQPRNSYYQQSLRGTNWPERFAVRFKGDEQ